MNILKALRVLRHYDLNHQVILFALRFIAMYNNRNDFHVKTHKEFAKLFQVSDLVVTRSLGELNQKGLLEFEEKPRVGRGKPQRVYAVTAEFIKKIDAVALSEFSNEFTLFALSYFSDGSKLAAQKLKLQPSEALVLFTLIAYAEPLGVVKGVSRALIESATGLNKVTISKKLKCLSKDGWVSIISAGFNETKLLGRQTSVYLINSQKFNLGSFGLPYKQIKYLHFPSSAFFDVIAPPCLLSSSHLYGFSVSVCKAALGKDFDLLSRYLKRTYTKLPMAVKRRLLFNLAWLASKIVNEHWSMIPYFPSLNAEGQDMGVDYKQLFKAYYGDICSISNLPKLDDQVFVEILGESDFKAARIAMHWQKLNSPSPYHKARVSGSASFFMPQLRFYFLVCSIVIACEIKKIALNHLSAVEPAFVGTNSDSSNVISILYSFELVGPIRQGLEHLRLYYKSKSAL